MKTRTQFTHYLRVLKRWEFGLEKGPKIKLVMLCSMVFITSLAMGFSFGMFAQLQQRKYIESLKASIATIEKERMDKRIEVLRYVRTADSAN
ncbi:MAG: hypothetical protein AAB874_05415 [Patescibacteria group bacterium]